MRHATAKPAPISLKIGTPTPTAEQAQDTEAVGLLMMFSGFPEMGAALLGEADPSIESFTFDGKRLEITRRK